MNTDHQLRFLNNCLFGGQKFVELNVEETSANPQADDIHWVHIDLRNEPSIEWLRNDSGLDQAIIDGLAAEETRPRSSSTDTGVFVVLRGVNMNPGEDAEDMVSVRLWIEPRRIISVRRLPILSVQDVYKEIKAGTGPKSAGEFLTDLIERLADRIGNFVNAIEDNMSEAEDSLGAANHNEFRSTLGSLRRQIAQVRRFLAPQRDALDRLNHVTAKVLSERDRQRLREESDRVSRYLEDLDLARERAVVLQEAFVSQLAQEQNTRMYVLSVVAAIFLPLTFWTGLLGMNVGGLPWIEDSAGFVLSVLVMLVSGILMIAFFKYKKWF